MALVEVHVGLRSHNPRVLSATQHPPLPQVLRMTGDSHRRSARNCLADVLTISDDYLWISTTLRKLTCKPSGYQDPDNVTGNV